MKGEQVTERGFSIQCPHCFQWTDWDVPPEKVALDSEEELREILDGLQADPEGYSNDKLLRCGQSRWVCPAPIEAFVCKNDADAHRFLETVEAWSLKRDFRLYKTDHRNRWPTSVGVGILFSTQPVSRQRHIELEHLVYRALLSHAIVGIGEDLKGPFTVYAATVFEHEGKDYIYWAPVEADRPGPPKAPPRYNAFCRICRQEVIKQTVETFTAQNPSPLKCPRRNGQENKTCAKMYASGKAPCEEKDWNHCPAFLELREKECPCYQSDRKMTAKIEKRWWEGDASFKKPLVQKCWAGFTEIALPIVVHDHLVGVAMTGQLVMNPSDLLTVDELVSQYPVLKPVRAALEDVRKLLVGKRGPDENKSDEEYADEVRTKEFCAGNEELQRRIEVVRESVNQIANAAQAQYHQIRARLENTFKQELLGLVANDREDPQFFDDPVCDILNRMRKFWAFKAVYLFVRPPASKDLNIVAYSKANDNWSHGFPGQNVATVPEKYRPVRPLPWLHDTEDSEPPDTKPAQQLFPVLNGLRSNSTLAMPEGRYLYWIIIPTTEHLFAFCFAARDEKAVSPLRHVVPGGASYLAHEAILESCTEVIWEIGEFLFRDAQDQAWKKFHAQASTRVGNQLEAAVNLLNALKPASWSGGSDQEREKIDLAATHIRRAASMLERKSGLMMEGKPRCYRSDLRSIIRQAKDAVVSGGIGFDMNVLDDCQHACVDAKLFEEAFRELFKNAVTFGGGSTRIEVVAWREQAKAVGMRGFPTQQCLFISIRNSGSKISTKSAPRVFDLWYTTDPDHAGLGLPNVRKIVEAHGGWIQAVPSETEAHFLITLPFSLASDNGQRVK